MTKKSSGSAGPMDTGWKNVVYTSLSGLGLGEDEIRLYTTSTELGPTSVASLARHMSLSRPSIYKLIGRLAAVGLARLPDRGAGQSKFLVEAPTAILSLLNEKKHQYAGLDRTLTGAMDEIIAVHNRGSRPASIQMYHGRSQLKHLYESILYVPNPDIRFFGSGVAFITFLTPEEYAARTARKVKLGIWNRILLPSTESHLVGTPMPETALRDIRVFDSSSAFSTIFQLVGDKVIFWWPETLMAMSIADPSLFKMMEDIFTKYWESAIPAKDFFDKEGNPKKAPAPAP